MTPEQLALYTAAARSIIADAVAALDEFPGEEPSTEDLLAGEDVEEQRRG